MNNQDLSFNKFPKDNSDLYLILDLLTFDSLFQLLLRIGLSNEQAINFILINCSFNVIIFQERIHNYYYRKIKIDNREISIGAKTQLYYDFVIKKE